MCYFIYKEKQLQRKFYTEIAHFTKTQLRSAQDQCTLIQAMMLLDVKNGEYKLNSISEQQISFMNGSSSLQTNITQIVNMQNSVELVQSKRQILLAELKF